MKKILPVIFQICLLATAHCDDLQLKDGRNLKGYRIINHSAVDAIVIHEGGAENISFDLLPIDLQKKYGYDPQKAEEYLKEQIISEELKEEKEERLRERKAKWVKKLQAEQSMRQIEFKQVAQLGATRLVVIHPNNANRRDLKLLFKSIKKDAQNDSMIIYQIFKSTKAAMMRQRIFSLSENERNYYHRNYIAVYFKNASQGLEEMDIHPQGMLGWYETLK